MRVLITADLHYDILRSREPTEALAARACKAGGDALVLVGDIAGADVSVLRDCLALFAGFGGRKLFVPGNHDLWRLEGESSLHRYRHVLPAVAAEEGFVMLDHAPQTLGGVGLVGSVGWYDYSFRDESLGLPHAFYEHKVAPGAAAYYDDEYGHLIDSCRGDLTSEQMDITARWMDGVWVRLGMSDAAFAGQLADRLAAQLADLAGRTRRILAFIHHLPFREQVPRDRPPRFAFAAAFMGAERLGQALLAEPKVTHVFSGHSHWPDRRRIGHVQAVNIGSTYVDKQLEVLDLED